MTKTSTSVTSTPHSLASFVQNGANRPSRPGAVSGMPVVTATSYLPQPLPRGWSVRGYGCNGGLTIDAEELEIAMNPVGDGPPKVMLVSIAGGKNAPDDYQVLAVLQRFRRIHKFVERDGQQKERRFLAEAW